MIIVGRDIWAGEKGSKVMKRDALEVYPKGSNGGTQELLKWKYVDKGR